MAESPSSLSPRVVLVPNTLVSQGTGHLRRCAAVAQASPDVALWLCLEPRLLEGETFRAEDLESLAGSQRLQSWPESFLADVVVLDFQKTPPALLAWVRGRARVLVGWDEGGRERRSLPFLVDSLPHRTEPWPNVRLPGLLGYASGSSVPRERFSRPVRQVVVTFGGADPQHLTEAFWNFWEGLAPKPAWTLTFVRGPLSKLQLPAQATVADNPPDFRGLLAAADLVITSWGLTVLESLSVGTPVVLLNPSAYHERLAREAKLPTFGVRQPRRSRFRKALRSTPVASREAALALLPEPLSADYWVGFNGTDARCPVCRTSGHPVFARTRHKSFHRCGSCSLEYLSVYQLPPKVYSDAYFFEDYQAQYGKTYLQDFAHIASLGEQRLAFLHDKLGRHAKRAFDVGCAYGPFLAAAAKTGLSPYGLDIADSAVRHVREVLGFPAVCASWLDFSWEVAFPGAERPDLLTMWYVIEHFPDLDAVLRRVSQTLAPDGVFAFGTPNGEGLTRRFRGSKFWEESPDDHFSVWNRRSARRILRRYGFRVLGFRNTGLHPERFPGLSQHRGWRYALVTWWGRWAGWGDTFEVYAQKVRELP